MKNFDLIDFDKKLPKYNCNQQKYINIDENVSPWEDYCEEDYEDEFDEDEEDDEEYSEEESEKPQTIVDLLNKVSALIQTKAFKALFNAIVRTFNSSLTAMRSAWKLCLAGCPVFANSFIGLLFLMISTNWNVVSIGLLSRALTIFLAME